MENASIRRHAHQVVRQNFWKIILVSILVSIIISAVLSIFMPALLIGTGFSYDYTLEDLLLENYKVNTGSLILFQIISILVIPLLVVGVNFWMPLNMSDTGEYRLSEWFGAFGRNTWPAILNVIFYNVASVLVAVVIAFASFFLFIALFMLFFSPFTTGVREASDLSLGLIILAFLLIIIFFLALLPLFFIVQFLFTMPYFIVYDINGISFSDVWKMNQRIIRGKFWPAFRLQMWYALVMLGVILGYLLIGSLILGTALFMSHTGLNGLTLAFLIIYIIVTIALSILFFIPFNMARQTAWATFYREAMKERQAEIEAEFPHINFGTLFKQGLVNTPSPSQEMEEI